MASASLRGRLVAALLGAVALTWAFVGLATYRDARREVDAVLDAHLAQTASLVAGQAGHELVELGSDGLGPLAPYGQAVAFQVWNPVGQLLLRSINAPATPFSATTTGFSNSEALGRHWRVFGAESRDRKFRVLVAEDRANRDRLAARFIVRALSPLVFGVPILGVLVWLAVGGALRPLVALRGEVARRDAHDLSPVGGATVPPEVRPLVEQINALLERIRRSLESERRFTSQAAHELRTPVAAIRAQAEVALGAHDPAASAHALRRVIDSCDRLSRLVGQLLVLARLDEAPRRSSEQCELGDAAARVISDLAQQALDRRIDIELVRGDRVIVGGNAMLLETLLRNLVDNSIRHGRAGGHVRVSVASSGDSAVLRVADDGPGVPDGERADLGRPFVRLEGAAGSGTGLGLSIVRRIAEEHRASMRYGVAADLGGFEVELRFPTTPA